MDQFRVLDIQCRFGMLAKNEIPVSERDGNTEMVQSYGFCAPDFCSYDRGSCTGDGFVCECQSGNIVVFPLFHHETLIKMYEIYKQQQ